MLRIGRTSIVRFGDTGAFQCGVRCGNAGVGSLFAARVGSDGWTVELDFLGLSTGTPDPTKLTVSAAPPTVDYLGVPMSGVSTRNISGAASNLNPVYDADFPFPSLAVSGIVLTVPVPLAAPVRSGETVGITVAGGLVTGSQGGTALATNGSTLRPMRYVQDQFGVDATLMVATVDCVVGCRTPKANLKPVQDLPSSLGTGGKYDRVRYDSVGKRVFIGSGATDATSPVLADVDFTTVPGVYITVNAPNATIRDCLLDDHTIYPIIFGLGAVDTTKPTTVKFTELVGTSKDTVLSGGAIAASGTTAAVANIGISNKVIFKHVWVHGTCGDAWHVPIGELRQCCAEDLGWDNRTSQVHADGFIAVPSVGPVVTRGCFFDHRNVGGGFGYATGGSISGTTLTLTLDDVSGFAVGQQVTVAGVTPAGYSGRKTITAVNAGAKTVSYSVASNVGAPVRAAAFVSYRSLSGAYGFDNPYSATALTGISNSDYKSDGLDCRRDVLIANKTSYIAANAYCRGSLANAGDDAGSGTNTLPVPDNRYVRGIKVQDCWMTKPDLATSPLFPQDKSKAHTIWPPDSVWANCRDPATLGPPTWTMGPQPADTEYFVTVDSPTHAAGDTVVYTLRIDYYLAQYGAETITISQSGAGFTNSLATDMAAAIAGIIGLSFSGGVLTISPGATGNRKGQSNQGLYVTISRPTNVGASGAHSLTLSGLTDGHGTISAASASTTLS